jgi:hypothetical protein
MILASGFLNLAEKGDKKEKKAIRPSVVCLALFAFRTA